MASYNLCDFYQITSHEIALRKTFLDFNAEDEENLKHINLIINEEVDSIVAEFYEHLSTFDELDRFISDKQTLNHLKQSQRKYLLSFGQNTDLLDYYENRLRIGMTHERAGLKQKWYLDSYSTLTKLISKRLSRTFADNTEKLSSIQVSLQKVITLDSALAVETYYQATMQRLESILQQSGEAQRNLQEISRVDGLTQINNRRFLIEALEMELHCSYRFNHDFALLFIDIDHFKHMNDTLGHSFGDFVLRKTIQIIREVLRPSDIIGRYGGEEFAIGLVETDETAARQIAERIRLKVTLAT